MTDAEFKKIYDIVAEKLKGRILVFWGGDNELKQRFCSSKMAVGGTYTSNKSLLETKPDEFIDYKQLNGKNEEYFVFMPFILPDTSGRFQIEEIESFGYTSDDYYLLSKVSISKKVDYLDCFKNKVFCSTEKVKIHIFGRNNTVIIRDSAVIMGELSVNISGNNNYVEIYKTKFRPNTDISILNDTSTVIIGESCEFNGTNVFVLGECRLEIGKNSTFNWNNRIYMHKYSTVIIGEDCMFGMDILIQSGDGHSIFDLNTQRNTNMFLIDDAETAEYKIVINDHVWLGRNSAIICNNKMTEIGEGSIVGTCSLVKGCFPNNVIIAGVPGKIKKDNIAWARKPRSSNISDCGDYIKHTNYFNAETKD